MRYYFFKTVNITEGGTTKPRLRALPNQTLPDGTPVNTDWNVQAPKEKGKYPGGSREDYPVGTIFCSDSLLPDGVGKEYYTIYSPNTNKNAPNFHPILSKPELYLEPEHRNKSMENQYALFVAGFGQESNDDDTEQDKPEGIMNGTEEIRFRPCDGSGKANPVNPAWTERYPNQLTSEAAILVKWMSELFKSKGVTPAVRLLPTSETLDLLKNLYRTGENIDTLASRTRFELYLKSTDNSYAKYAVLKNPHVNYLSWLMTEHNRQSQCTAIERNPELSEDMSDAMMMVAEAHCNVTGLTAMPTNQNLDNIKAAIRQGWTLDRMIEPENLKKASELGDYLSQLASGTIPAPKMTTASNLSNLSYIDTILANRMNRKPDDRSGFHVDDITWKVLMNNFHRKWNTLIIGPSGSGKTELIKLLCSRTNTPLTIIQGGAITDPTEQLVGNMDYDTSTGGTVFNWADFALAVQQPGVILIDEINRIPKNGDNLLFSCLDKTRALPAYAAKGSDTRTIPVHPECCSFATANIGDEYTGTKQIDAALMTRFRLLEMSYMKMETEAKLLTIITGIKKEDATNIAMCAATIRQKAQKSELESTVSTRETIAAAEYVRDGFTVLEALETVFLPLFDKGAGNDDAASERMAVKGIFSQRFNNKTKQ